MFARRVESTWLLSKVWQMLHAQLRAETLTSSLIIGDSSGFRWFSVLCAVEENEPLSLSRYLSGNEAIRWLRVRWIEVETSSAEDEEFDSSGLTSKDASVMDSKAMPDIRLYAHKYINNDWPNIVSSVNRSAQTFFVRKIYIQFKDVLAVITKHDLFFECCNIPRKFTPQ